MNETILWEEELRGGQTWSQVLDPGMALRFTDLEGGANVSCLFYNAQEPSERYNMPDTLKAQHIARLTKGFVLYSDMGRILCSVTEDTVGLARPVGRHVVGRPHRRQLWREALPAEGNQAVDTLFYNAQNHADHYSAVNTIAAQGNIYLTTGSKLLSQEGNGLMTIVDDTCTLGGAMGEEAGAGGEVLEGRLGVEADLDGCAANGDGHDGVVATGQADHPLDQVDAGDRFGDAVLHLETSVDFEEVELLAVAIVCGKRWRRDWQ